MKVFDSPKKTKRFVAVFSDGDKIHFGSKNSKTYIDHGNEILRKNYLARHRKNENWNNPKSAGSLSRYITWGNSKDINKNIKDFKQRFF